MKSRALAPPQRAVAVDTLAVLAGQNRYAHVIDLRADVGGRSG